MEEKRTNGNEGMKEEKDQWEGRKEVRKGPMGRKRRRKGRTNGKEGKKEEKVQWEGRD